MYKSQIMRKEYSISIYLDTRRSKSSGKYPVKLRVYTSAPRQQKLYPTIFEFTEKEFESIWNTTKPRREHQETRKMIVAVEVKANKVAEKLQPFRLDQFERRLYRKPGDGVSVKYHYTQIISEFNGRDQLGTASTYDLSQKSIIDFVEKTSSKIFKNLTLYDITSKWLEDYEHYMIETKGRTPTTVSMYLRSLRAVYNKAIAEDEIDRGYYPFGKRKYQIPATSNVKKTLSKQQLKSLFNVQPGSAEQEKAKDFWFFSYACNGMNIKDIAMLRYKDINDGKIEFIRAKTRITSKANLKPITAYQNEFTEGIIKKYGNDSIDQNQFVFDIIKDSMKPQQKQNAIKNFTRFINQHLKKLCKANDLPEQISTYWARHSFATNAVRKGASMEFIQESLGHGNVQTTQKYFAGFDNETRKQFSNEIMDFD